MSLRRSFVVLQTKQAALRQAEEEKTAKRRAKRMKKKVPRHLSAYFI